MRHKRKQKKIRRPELSEKQILEWADSHHELYGKWPTKRSRPQVVTGAPAERWCALDNALVVGLRGLPGGSSLARLLAAKRGVRNRMQLPELTIEQILGLCDEYHSRTQEWPNQTTDRGKGIPGTNGDTWGGVDQALRVGRRGLPGGSSLALMLAEHRGVRNQTNIPSLTNRQVLAWADAHYEENGRWPRLQDWRKEIPDSNGELWGRVFQAVALGLRGLRGGSTFWDLLSQHRKFRNINHLPQLSYKQVIAWADRYYKTHGTWPFSRCEPQLVPNTMGETWFNLHQALRLGLRGFPGGSSLAKLLFEFRGVPNINATMKYRMARKTQ